MPLNENEERILNEIEQRFYANDPESARRIGSTTLPKYLARNCKWATLGFVVGLAEPPAGSTVTATTAPLGTVRAIGTTVAPRPPRKSPAGSAPAPRTTHAS